MMNKKNLTSFPQTIETVERLKTMVHTLNYKVEMLERDADEYTKKMKLILTWQDSKQVVVSQEIIKFDEIYDDFKKYQKWLD
jgi:hypothetical protein